MKQKAFVFDLDGTLFETTAEVLEGTNGPDYVEFKDVHKLLNESKPLPLMELAQQVHNEGHKVFILTARRNIIGPAVKKLMTEYGVQAEYVFCVGDRGFDVASYKAEILRELSDEYETYFYDNEIPNLIMAQHSGAKVYKA